MIPLATTTIDVYAPAAAGNQDPYGEGYDSTWTAAENRVSHNIRAVISINEQRADPPPAGGDAETIRYRLVADPCTLDYLARIKDTSTGLFYEVLWTTSLNAVAGLDHIRAGLRRIQGVAG